MFCQRRLGHPASRAKRACASSTPMQRVTTLAHAIPSSNRSWISCTLQLNALHSVVGMIVAGDRVRCRAGAANYYKEEDMIIRGLTFVALLVLLVSCGQPPDAGGPGDAALNERVRDLLENQLAAIESAVDENDIAAARGALAEFQTAFADIQADVAAAAPEVSETISTTVANLEAQLNAETVNVAAVNEELAALRRALESLAAGGQPRVSPSP